MNSKYTNPTKMKSHPRSHSSTDSAQFPTINSQPVLIGWCTIEIVLKLRGESYLRLITVKPTPVFITPASKGKQLTQQNRFSISVTLDSLFMLLQIDAFQIIKYRILDTELQSLYSMANTIYSPLSLKILNGSRLIGSIFIISEKTTQSFFLQLVPILLSPAIFYRRFEKVAYLARYCPCGTSCTETILHVLLYCSFYVNVHSKYLSCILTNKLGLSNFYKVHCLFE